MKSVLFTLLFCCFLASFACAQQTLEVYKRGTKKHYYFMTGDTLRLKLEGKKEALTGSWGYVDEEHIWLRDTLVNLSAISWIDISEKSKGEANWELPANLLLIAGIGYFAVDQLNMLIDTGGKPVINRQVLLTSAGFVAAGLLIKAVSSGFRNKKAKIGKKYALCISDYSS